MLALWSGLGPALAGVCSADTSLGLYVYAPSPGSSHVKGPPFNVKTFFLEHVPHDPPKGGYMLVMYQLKNIYHQATLNSGSI